MIGVRMLVMAKVSPAPSMKIAPSKGALEAEESWFIWRPFRNQFPQGYGKALRPAARATGSTLHPVLFHPDYTVGSGITPDLLTPAAAGRSRAWRCRLTAGGELHPALRTMRDDIIGSRRSK